MVRITLGLTLVAALAVGLQAPVTADDPERRAGQLDFSVNGGYRTYVGGQGITLTGRLPKAGVRTIFLERNMNRPGSTWTKVEDLPYRGKTRADGSFTMPILATDMVDLSYRVRGAKGGGVTPGVRFAPKTQDVTMEVVDPLGLPIDPLPFVPFFIAADTTPDLFRRPDTEGLPVFEGRELTLQRQVSPTEWETVGTTEVGRDGEGIFLTSPQSVAAGDHVYRVRMEDWTEDGSDVGWQATFPTVVTVGSPFPLRGRAGAAAPAPRVPVLGAAPSRIDARIDARIDKVTDTASSTYGWFPLRWSFDWQEGQDLDSPPKVGGKGSWVQYTDGLGRVGKHNGGIRLDSGRFVKDGSGDLGTTRATMTGNPDAYGRWESRLRLKTFEARGRDYDVLVELVPARARDYDCGRQNITVARYSGTSRRMTFGVNAGTKRWTKTITAPSLTSAVPALAVEVARDHITWFVDAKPVGALRSKAAVSDVPMTLRMSLVGEAGVEHVNTSIYSDWQRSYDIDSGRQVKKGPKLKRSALTACPE